jgi:hypothetical protein
MTPYERWQAEICAGHRWGKKGPELFAERLPRELQELEALWQAAAPLADHDVAILDQVIGLEICNWRLTDSILDLTEAIGAHTPAACGIGHRMSITEERWTIVWAYYLALQQYIWANTTQDAFRPLLDVVDADGAVRQKITEYLGERDEMKELLVQRLLYAMHWMVSHFPWESPWHQAQNAGIAVLENRLQELGVEPEFLRYLAWPVTDGRLQPCSHKWVRRLDIIISSIGSGKWRGRIPFRGTDGLELARLLDDYLSPLADWLQHDDNTCRPQEREPGVTIWRNLGESDPAKRFLARLLHSLLTAQQIEARLKGEERSRARG